MNKFIIAKEGFNLIVVVAIMTMIMLFISDTFLVHLFMLLLLVGTVYMFRNPSMNIERFEKCEILSACDGVISNIETLECNGNIKGECYKVTVVNRFIDKGVLRAPYDSTTPLVEHYRGMQLALHSKKAKYLNENGKILFRSSDNPNDIMVIRHRLNRFDIPLSFSVSKDKNLEIGERYGFMLHGEISMFLPSSSRLAIKVGDELQAGETLIGYFTR